MDLMPWRWIVVKETKLTQYLQHKYKKNKRKIFKKYSNLKEPIDWQWIETGEFKPIKRPPAPPSRTTKKQ